MKLRPLTTLLLLGILTFSGWIHLTNLDWGVPSMKRTLSVSGSLENLKSLVPEMLEQRKKYYEMIDSLLDKNQELKPIHDKLSNRWNVSFFSEIPREIVLDRMRNYLIGANISDEQITLSSIGEMNPKRLDFVPGPLAYYGGLYYYTAAGFLVISKILGEISLTPGVEYYFYHPEESGHMFSWVRAVGGVSILLAIGFVFISMTKFYDEMTGLCSAGFLAVFPLMVSISHLTKTHLYGMFWLSIAVYFSGKILKSERPQEGLSKEFNKLGMALGLCSGTIITNLVSGFMLLLTELAAQDWRIRPTLKSQRFWVASILFLLMFGLTNFYLFFRLPEFIRHMQSNALFFPAIFELGLREWGSTLLDISREQTSILVFPLLLLGILQSFRRKDKFMRVCFWTFLILFLQNFITTRHAPVNARYLPLLAVLAGWGNLELLREISSQKIKLAITSFIIFALSVSAVQCAYYRKLHQTPTSLDQAASWINQNIPKGSTLGAWGGGFAPFEFPAIEFLKYRMISIPHPADLDSTKAPLDKMPQYLILSTGYAHGLSKYPSHELIDSQYLTVQEWAAPWHKLEKWFGTIWVRTGNWNTKILEKR